MVPMAVTAKDVSECQYHNVVLYKLENEIEGGWTDCLKAMPRISCRTGT